VQQGHSLASEEATKAITRLIRFSRVNKRARLKYKLQHKGQLSLPSKNCSTCLYQEGIKKDA
jgi:hypothetical protein